MNKCKNKKCQKELPEGYKFKYCENCRNNQISILKKVGKGTLTALGFVGTVALALLNKNNSDNN